MSNVYYDPENFGLKILGEIDFSSGSYEFDVSVVWADVETGALYYADDSGCSCPAPFEDTGRNDLTKVERTQDLIDYFESRKADAFGDPADLDAPIGELIRRATR